VADVVPISDRLREAREQVLRSHVDAITRGDVDAAVQAYRHPRIEIVGTGRVVEGADGVRCYLEDQRRAFPDQAFELICLHHSDRAVIAELWMTGTHVGDVHGVEATGKRFKVRIATICEFDGDGLVNQRFYYDHGTVARQLA